MKLIVFGAVIAIFSLVCLLAMRSYRYNTGVNGRSTKLPRGFKLLRAILVLTFLFGAGITVFVLVTSF